MLTIGKVLYGCEKISIERGRIKAMKTMKAWVLHDIGKIHFEEVDRPEPADNEVLVEVKAAGICGSDIPRIYQTGAHTHPLIPGHEFAGRVIGLGRNANAGWQDKRVGIFPLIPCNNCVACREQHYELCRNYSYLGSRRDGGFAEYVTVPEWNLIRLPDNVSYRQAATMEPMAVAVHAMRNALSADADRRRSIAVCGFGTIGIMLTMFLVEAGYSNIYVVGNKDFQKEMAVKLGIGEERFYDSKNGDAHEWLMAQTEGVGVDVFFECVGKNATVTSAVMGTAPNGTVQLVGNPASDMLFRKEVYWKILRDQLTVRGSWNSSFQHDKKDDWCYVLDKLQEEKIRPDQCITHRFSLETLEQGLLIMRDKTQEYVKVMTETGA